MYTITDDNSMSLKKAGWQYFDSTFFNKSRMKDINKCRKELKDLELDEVEILLKEIAEETCKKEEASEKKIKEFIGNTYSVLEGFCKKEIKRFFPITNRISKELKLQVSQLFRYDSEKALLEFQKDKGLFYLPLEKDIVLLIIEYFFEIENFKAAREWISVALNCMSDDYANHHEASKKKYKETYLAIKEKIETDDCYKKALNTLCVDEKAPNRVFRISDKNTIVDKNEKTDAPEKDDSVVKNLKMENQVLLERIGKLNADKIYCENDKKILKQRLETQILINEKIAIANSVEIMKKEEQIESLNQACSLLKDELLEKNSIIDFHNTQIKNLRADLDNEIALNQKLSQTQMEDDKQSRFAFISDFLNQIDPPLYNFCLSISALKNTRINDSGNIDLLNEIYQGIVDSFRVFGVELFGEINSIVPYDYEFHDLDVTASKGTPVRIIKSGWKTADRVIWKAIVGAENE